MSVVHDVRVRVRANIIVDELHDQGDAHTRKGSNGAQSKQVLDLPTLHMSSGEWATRLADAQKVIQYGYRVTASSIPPTAETAGVTLLTKNAATINGYVTSGGGNANTGFQYGTSRALGTSAGSTEGATGGAVTTPTARSARMLGLTPGTKYYYRVYVTEIGLSLTQYGVVKSFTTPLI